VCEALGLARSNVHALRSRPATWVDGRTQRTPRGDDELLAEIREQIAELPSYGYRRACALVNQQRPAGAPRVNPKRAYRVMAGNGLLLPKAPTRPHSSRLHNGTVAVSTSDTRWCSDGFEIKCDSGQTVTTTFAKDCCDREILAFRAWEGKGLPGEPVREMLIEAVEKRFGAVEAVPVGHGAGVPLRQRRRLHRARHSAHRQVAGLDADQHARLQPAEQRHGRELRQHLPARLREQDGPYRRADGARAARCGLRTLQRAPPALEPEDAIAA
jgi:hypothetical protein